MEHGFLPSFHYFLSLAQSSSCMLFSLTCSLFFSTRETQKSGRKGIFPFSVNFSILCGNTQMGETGRGRQIVFYLS